MTTQLTTMYNAMPSRSHQNGAALIVSLVMLTALTILGVSSMQQGALQERMSRAVRDKTIALQAAEAALREGEEYLRETTVPKFSDPPTTDGLWTPTGDDEKDRWHHSSVDWNKSTHVREVTVSGVSKNPRYIIVRIPNVPYGASEQLAGDQPLQASAVLYRITAKGWGITENGYSVLRSSFRKER